MRKLWGEAGKSLEDPWSLSGYLPLPQTAWDPGALCHPPCFEDKQNYLTHSRKTGWEGPREMSPYYGVVLFFGKGTKLQRQRVDKDTEDRQCDDLRVLVTLGDTWVDEGPAQLTLEGRRWRGCPVHPVQWVSRPEALVAVAWLLGIIFMSHSYITKHSRGKLRSRSQGLGIEHCVRLPAQ